MTIEFQHDIYTQVKHIHSGEVVNNLQHFLKSWEVIWQNKKKWHYKFIAIANHAVPTKVKHKNTHILQNKLYLVYYFKKNYTVYMQTQKNH